MFASLHRLPLVLMLALSLTSTPLLAEDEESDEAATPDVQYVELDPALVINLAGQGKRSRYLQLNVVVRVLGEDKAERVKYHEAPVRHALLMLISGRDRTEISDIDAREKLRQEAREVVQTTLSKYEESLEIQDLLFTNYVVQ